MPELSDAIARKVRALLSRTTDAGCTEAEAIEAAAKARELMDRYRVTLSDVEIKAEPITQETVERPNSLRWAAGDYALHGINAYCGVKTWFHKSAGVRRLRIFGMKPDVEMARYLYELINAVVNVECARWQRTPEYLNAYSRRSATGSFKLGMAIRINERLKQMAKDLAPVAKSANGTALVVVKGAVVEAAYAGLGLRLGVARQGASVRDSNGFNAGRSAGDRVNLSRPLSRGKQALLF